MTRQCSMLVCWHRQWWSVCRVGGAGHGRCAVGVVVADCRPAMWFRVPDGDARWIDDVRSGVAGQGGTACGGPGSGFRSRWSVWLRSTRRPASWGSRGWPELTNTAGPAGGGGAEGRAAVTGCEPPASGGGGSGAGWLALVWCNSGLPVGIARCGGLPLAGWRAAEVVTRLSHVARNMVVRRGIR